jgi:long-chain acyl-CoA synthetase
MISSLAELITAQAARGESAIAFTEGSSSVSWPSLEKDAKRIARAMISDGIAPQERIAYVGKNSGDFIRVMFAAGLANLIFVPLNWRLSPNELAALIVDTGSRLVVVDAEHEPALEVAAALTGVARVVASGSVAAKWTNLADWGSDLNAGTVLPVASADDIAFQLYTSGTTGRPKGAMFANGTNLRVLMNGIREAWRFTEDDVSLVAMPMFHMGGLAWLLAGMAGGSRAVLIRDFDPVSVLETCEREEVTAAFFVPTMLYALLGVPGVEERQLALRRVVYSGSPMAPARLLAAMSTFRSGFVQIYGMTEATGAFAQLEADDHEPGGPREHLLKSSGRAYPWVEVKIVDTATLSEVEAGLPGEVWTRSEQNMIGYFNREEETRATLLDDGWLRTGDIGYLDSDGYIFLLDRHKDMIISGGENIYPAEIEGVLLGHPDIAEVAVIGVPSEKWGESVTALIVPRPGATIDGAEVLEFTRSQLARFKCPSAIEIVEELPRTPTGKVRKDVLREPYWAGMDRHIN